MKVRGSPSSRLPMIRSTIVSLCIIYWECVIVMPVSFVVQAFQPPYRGFPSQQLRRTPFACSRDTRLPKTTRTLPFVDLEVGSNLTTITIPLHSTPKLKEDASLHQEFPRQFYSKEQDWMEAEIKFYRDSPHGHTYVPRMTSNKGTSVPLWHLEAAANEFARRFPHRSVEDEQQQQPFDSDAIWSGSPALLVANNVKDNWRVPCKFRNQHNVGFVLVPGDTKDTSTLFIKCMAGPHHGLFHSLIHVAITNWVNQQYLNGVIWCISSGGKSCQPDLAFGPNEADWLNPTVDNDVDELGGQPYARLIVELEYAHRDARELRRDGLKVLSRPYARLFLAVKIWEKGISGNFGAAAVLWSKNDDNVICFQKAIDFGTKQLESRSKELFEVPGDDNSNLLPPVLDWTRPQPRPGYDSLRSELDSYMEFDDFRQIEGLLPNDDWYITLPTDDLLFKTSTQRSTDEMPYILDTRYAIPDCEINLQEWVWQAMKGKLF